MGTGRRNKYKKTQLGGEVYSAIGPLVFPSKCAYVGRGVEGDILSWHPYSFRRLAFVLQDYPLT